MSQRGLIFDRCAEEYDALRPSYPEPAVDAVLAGCDAPPRAALEVGCGTGQATRLFARRGLRITALEPAEAMAALARRNLAGLDVEVVVSRFEDWPLPEEPFDLLFAAQSFHWVDPEVALPRAARVLAPGGRFGLFWNRSVGFEPGMRSALDACYAAHAPELLDLHVVSTLPDLEPVIAASGLFDDLATTRHPWTDRRTSDEYVRLISTFSHHAALPDARRKALLDAIRGAVDERGGEIDVEHDCIVYTGRRS